MLLSKPSALIHCDTLVTCHADFMKAFRHLQQLPGPNFKLGLAEKGGKLDNLEVEMEERNHEKRKQLEKQIQVQTQIQNQNP